MNEIKYELDSLIEQREAMENRGRLLTLAKTQRIVELKQLIKARGNDRTGQ